MPGNAQNNMLPELRGFLFEGSTQDPAIIIYSPKITARLRHSCKFIFNQGLLFNFILIDNENEFIASKLAKINYSVKTFENALNIDPSGLLSETGIKEFAVPHKVNEDTVVFFPGNSDPGFDIFAAVFYCISRYEEWQTFTKDKHGRFEIENSIFKKLSIHKIPIVDVWIQNFKQVLTQKFRSLQFPARQFRFISTIDVDNVFAYKAKPWFRQGGGALKDLVKLDLKNLRSRLNTILLGKKDPFDEYAFQAELSKKYNIPLIYFFLYKNNTDYDRTIDPDHTEFIKLLSYLKQNNIHIGLHPSYYSNENPNLLNEEQKLLSKNSGKEVISSRQHFLRFNIKTTPKQLIGAGIQYDFTMGFASEAGFRAGTTLPFYYYDFDTETELNLTAVPFAAMDGAFYIYNNSNAHDAYTELLNLGNTIKTLNGLYVTVIHDRSFSEQLFPGWKNLYQKLHENLRT